MPGPANRSVVAVAYDGLCLFEFGVASELFGLARPELGVDWYEYEVVSVDPPPITAIGGVSLGLSTDLDLVRSAGTVVLPGWRSPDEPPPETLVAALTDAHANGARLMSICSGVFVLAATGLLDGQAATHPLAIHRPARCCPIPPAIDVRPEVLYIDNGSVLTSAGSAAGLDLGLHLIRRDHGSAIANQVARRLVVSPHRDGGQARVHPSAGSTRAGVIVGPDARVGGCQPWPEPLTVAQLAAHAQMSPRTFARRFPAEVGMSPHRWLVHQRVARAQELLETTTLGIDAVAARAGMGSAANLRHHFRTGPAAPLPATTDHGSLARPIHE